MVLGYSLIHLLEIVNKKKKKKKVCSFSSFLSVCSIFLTLKARFYIIK